MADDKDASSPGTEAFVPDFSDDDDAADTGTQSWAPDFDDDAEDDDTEAAEPAAERGPEPEPEPEPAGFAGPVPPVAVPGRYFYVKWWKLVLVLLAVWAASAVVGLGLFSWWYHSIDKTRRCSRCWCSWWCASSAASCWRWSRPGR
ncbi:hypothetical protein I549_1272 [Mycobacterium avium subsp. avium 2285 (R)]|nr:hypothetical protein I549_1272 [Mycobacterium avium subsp. avium 2285 (R)]